MTEQSILDDMIALPPNKEMYDKYYVGYYRGEELIAVLDFIMHIRMKKLRSLAFL